MRPLMRLDVNKYATGMWCAEIRTRARALNFPEFEAWGLTAKMAERRVMAKYEREQRRRAASYSRDLP